MKKTISLFLAVLMLMSTMAVAASAWTEKGTLVDGYATYSTEYDYTYRYGTATLTSYDCSNVSEVTIPNAVSKGNNVYYVKSIKSRAFKNAENVTELKIIARVSVLDIYFDDLPSLESLTFDEALNGGLEDIYGCPNLKYINITPNSYVDSPVFSVAGDVLFKNDGKTLVRFAPAKNTERYHIPEKVTKLGDYAFAETSVLKELVMYPGLSLDYYTFCNSSIEKVYFWGTQEEWDTFESKIHCNYGGKCGSKLCAGTAEICFPEYFAKVDATCTEDGTEEGYRFVELNESKGFGKIYSTGHNYTYVDNNDSKSCEDYGTATGTCTKCGDTVTERGSYENRLPHSYVSYELYDDANCYRGAEYRAACNYGCGSYRYEIRGEATGKHNGEGDVNCKDCGKYLPKDCKHICHKDGFVEFIYKVFVKTFWKLFKINPKCECGRAHY